MLHITGNRFKIKNKKRRNSFDFTNQQALPKKKQQACHWQRIVHSKNSLPSSRDWSFGNGSTLAVGSEFGIEMALDSVEPMLNSLGCLFIGPRGSISSGSWHSHYRTHGTHCHAIGCPVLTTHWAHLTHHWMRITRLWLIRLLAHRRLHCHL